jgi:hypothetical protein
MAQLTPGKKWFIITAVLAFLSVISFFQVNSYWADQNSFNTGWKIIGGIFGLGAVYSLFKAVKNSN